jgi:WD40 repeat protein
MESQLRIIWGRRLYSTLPLVGGWLRLRAVDRLARDGSPEAVRLLAEAVARSDDRRVCVEALLALQEVERPRCVEAVCEVWVATRNPYLEELLTVGGWVAKAPAAVRVLYQLVKGRLEEVAAGGAEVVEPLLHYGADADAGVAARARAVLGRLSAAEAREALCRLVIDRDDARAREVAVAAGYAPAEAGQRALFYFLTGQWEAYESLDFDRGLLRAVYHAADARLRQRIAEHARQAGRFEWVEVVTGGRQTLRLAEMTDAEWQATLEVLVGRRHWAELWRLAQDAPPRWAARLLQRPEVCDGLSQEPAGLQELVRLARAWQEPGLSATLRPRATLTGHTASVGCLAISPDGQLLASGGGDDTIRLWRLPEGRALRTLEGHTGAVTCLAISPRGRVLVSGSQDRTVRFWELPDGNPLPPSWRPNAAPVTCLAVSPRGKVVASGDESGRVWLWGLADGQTLQYLMPGSLASAFLPKAWSFADGQKLQCLNDYPAPVRCLAVSPDGRLLASANWSGGIRLWGLPKGEPLDSLTGYFGAVACLAFSPDGRLLASGGRLSKVHLSGVPGRRLLQTLEGHAGSIGCVAFSPDGRVLASGSEDNLVRLWRVPDGKAGEPLAGHIGHVSHLAFSPDGRVLASGGQDGTVELWGVPDGRPLQTLRGHTRALTGLVISADGQLLASGSEDGTVRVWNSDLVRLSRVPAGKFSGQDLAEAQEALTDAGLSAAERAALEFIVALVRWRRRFDIHLDDAPRHVEVGEFDIILAG